jgi:hypothetical protein
VGSLFFGFLADRVSVRHGCTRELSCFGRQWDISGFVKDYEQLLICRTLLGF